MFNHQLSPSTILFILFIFLSSIILLSSSSWLLLWLNLELNLMATIPIMLMSSKQTNPEAAIKYFLIQSVGSTIMFLSIIFTPFITYMPATLMLNLSLLMKMGAAPFHQWLPQVTNNLNWLMISILLTWQKVAPLSVISYLTTPYILITLMIPSALSALSGSMGGVMQTQMRPLLTYSSINHTAWILSSLMISPTLTMFYFFMYTMISLIVMFPMLSMTKFSTNKFSFVLWKTPLLSPTLMLNLLSLGGMPPLPGFLPKWILIMFIVNINLMLTLVLIGSSLIAMFFYLMIFLATLLSNNKQNTPSPTHKTPSLPLILSMTTLPILSWMM